MKKMGYFYLKTGFLFLLFSISFTFSFAQMSSTHVFQEWFKNEGLTDQAYKAKSVFDNAGNLYVVGGTINSNGDWDWMITKYDANTGLEMWTTSYDRNGLNDYATNVVVDANCNLYITGSVTADTSMGLDLGIIKIDSSGVVLWDTLYDNGQSFPYYNDGGLGITLDGSGYVYVTGGTEDASLQKEYITLKYDCVTGTQQWMQTYGGGLDDIAAHVYFDGTDINVTGIRTRTTGIPPTISHRVFAVRYNVSGTQIATTGISPTFPDTISEIRDVTTDNNGNIYVTGFLERPWAGTGKDVQVIKLDNTLDIQWAYTLPSYYYDDMANAIRVDNSGNVYVGGVQGYYKDAFLMKLDSTGNQDWIHNYTLGTGVGLESIESMVIGSDGNPILTGYAWIDEQVNSDYYTLKTDQTNGNIIWDITYNGLTNKDDFAYDVALDFQENVYVIGQSKDTSGITSNWITVKYVEHELYNIPDEDTIPSSFDVTSNLGQLRNADTLHTVNTTVEYYSAGLNAFFQNNSLIHVFARIDTSVVSPLDSLIRVDMILTSDTTRRVYGLNKKSFYTNYYLPNTTATKGLERVPSYDKAVYPEIYKSIDMITSANFNGIKEQFVVKPTGNSNNIEFIYDGADTIYVDTTGRLHIETILGNIVYQRPEVSQIDSGGNFVPIVWQAFYKLNGDTVSFDSIQLYNVNLPLVIEMNQGDDPLPARSANNPVWCTHYGGNMMDEHVGIDSDNSGNLYVTGHAYNLTFPHSSFILTGGGEGAGDIFMAKFSPYGVPIWRVLWGGHAADVGLCTKYDAAHNVVYSGGWTSGDLTPTDLYLQPQPAAYNHSALGLASYGYIGKFNASFGFLNWSTLFGEDDDDEFTAVYSMDVNTVGELVIGGVTRNQGTFPMVANTSGSCGGIPHQTSLTNKVTGFVSVFDNVNSLLWSTPFGSDNSSINDVRFAEQDLIYLTGYVGSGDASNFPLQHEFIGDYSVGHSGGTTDAFISKFEFNCWELKWSTMFGGNGNDNGATITPRFSPPGNVYFAGSTSSTASFPIVSNGNVNSINNSSNAGAQDGFIVRFRDNFLVWSTYVGGSGNDGISDSEIGDFDILYLLGNTRSTNYVNLNYSGAYNQSALEQISDATIIALDIVASHTNLWSTYFGGASSDSEDDEKAEQLSTSPNILYISGESRSNSNFPWNADLITYPSAYYQPFRQGQWRDLFLAQIDLLQTPIGIEEQSETDDFVVYPNPTSDLAYLKFDQSLLLNGAITVEIMDIQGRLVFNDRIQPISNGPIQINLVSLVDGFYVIRVNSNSWNASKKLIISH